MSSKQAKLDQLDERSRAMQPATLPINVSDRKPKLVTSIKFSENPLYDSEDEFEVHKLFGRNKAENDENIKEDDYVVLTTGNSQRADYEYNANFYGISVDNFDPAAQYFSESIVQWKLGVMPLAPTGAKVYTVKLQNIMSADLIQQYIDAGVTLLRVLDLNIRLVPQQFTETNLGSSSFKVVQGDYFDTQINKIYDNYDVELSEDITGLSFDIPTDRAPIAQLLQTSIASLTYRWYNCQIISNKPAEGSNINLVLLLTANVQPVSGAPFRINDKFNDGKEVKPKSAPNSKGLPAKFL